MPSTNLSPAPASTPIGEQGAPHPDPNEYRVHTIMSTIAKEPYEAPRAVSYMLPAGDLLRSFSEVKEGNVDDIWEGRDYDD